MRGEDVRGAPRLAFVPVLLGEVEVGVYCLVVKRGRVLSRWCSKVVVWKSFVDERCLRCGCWKLQGDGWSVTPPNGP